MTENIDKSGLSWVTACAEQDCVQVARTSDGNYAISGTGTSKVLVFSRTEFANFLEGVKSGRFDHLM